MPDVRFARIEWLPAKQRSNLLRLLRTRQEILRELRIIHSQLRALGGAPPQKQNRSVPSRENKRPLLEFVLESLKSHPEGLTVSDLTDDVLSRGYKTNSSQFVQDVRSRMTSWSPWIELDQKTQRCSLKKGSAKPRRRTKT